MDRGDGGGTARGGGRSPSARVEYGDGDVRMWSMATPRHSTITPAGRGSRMIRLGRVLGRFDSGYEVSAVKLPG